MFLQVITWMLFKSDRHFLDTVNTLNSFFFSSKIYKNVFPNHNYFCTYSTLAYSNFMIKSYITWKVFRVCVMTKQLINDPV